MSYEGLSLNMNYSALEFEWKLFSEGKTVNLAGKTLTGVRSRNLVLEVGSLEGGKHYMLFLFACEKGKIPNTQVPFYRASIVI
jgi:hypothetical protein